MMRGPFSLKIKTYNLVTRTHEMLPAIMSLDAILPPSSGGPAPFTDVRAAREWLKLLPLINTRQARHELDEMFTQLNAAQIDAVELLRCLELLRDAVHTTQAGLLPQYTGKALPLLAQETQRWQEAQSLWAQLETGYARCWRAVRDGHSKLAEHHALIAERTLRYGAYVARGYLLVYRPVPAEVWQRLFARYRLIEEAGLERQTVRDSVIDVHGSTMPQSMLISLLLLAAGGVRQLSSRQILWLDRSLEVLATRTTLAFDAATPQDKTGLQIDLDAPAPALRASKPLEGAGVRGIDTLALAKVLSKRIKLLREGELPQRLGLGNELAPQAAEALLTDLYRRWCDLPTELPLRRQSGARPIAVEQDLLDLHSQLTRDKPLQPPPEDRQHLDRQALEKLQLFGQTGSSARPPAPPRAVNTEYWEVQRETAQELLLLRPASSASRIQLQQLIGIAPAGSSYLAGVTRSLEEADDLLQVGVRLLPGVPQPARARPTDLMRVGQRDYSDILLLPAVPALKSAASLILPCGWHRPGRQLDIWDGSTLYRVRLVQALERGSNFERVLYALQTA
ncbi:MAG: hypothetical protein H6R07_2359 [Proteobacteria bacterium]|nr:hypothetical protein [Pseudomonadota bacterium]